jgi:FAD/FMN-containing dehydrogenase
VRNLERADISRSVAMKLTRHKIEAVYRSVNRASMCMLSPLLTRLVCGLDIDAMPMPDAKGGAAGPVIGSIAITPARMPAVLHVAVPPSVGIDPLDSKRTLLSGNQPVDAMRAMKTMHNLLRNCAAIVGGAHVLTGDATAGYAVDWTGRFRGEAAAVLRPADTTQVAAVLAACAAEGVAVVPQGGNTGLVGGGVPLHGEVVLSLARLRERGPVDPDSAQVTVGAGVTLQEVSDADPDLDLGVLIASRDSATVGGAIATNAGGLRVLRYGPMRAQLRGVQAVLSDGTVLSHLAGLRKDNTGYDYPSLLAGSEGTLAVVTAARLQLVPRPRGRVVALVGLGGLAEVHALAMRAAREVSGLLSAEFFTGAGLDILVAHTGMPRPLPAAYPAYLLLEAAEAGALDELGALLGDLPAAVGQSPAERERLWAYRERHPEVAGFLGVPIKLDVSVPDAGWLDLAHGAAAAVAAVDAGATVVIYGHVADGNVHVNVVPAAAADGRHEDAAFALVASLGGSISAEHGIGALKARWLPLVRSEAERALFARVRAAFDPAGILNPHVLPR